MDLEGNPSPSFLEANDSETTSPASQDSDFYLKNVVIECRVEDADHPAFNTMVMVVQVNPDNLDHGDTELSLERVLSSIWKYHGVIELHTYEQLTLFVRSHEYGDIGYIHLTGSDLMDIRGHSHTDNHLTRLFMHRAGGPILTISFEICILPSNNDRDAQQRHTSVLFEDIVAEILLLETCILPDDHADKPDKLIFLGDKYQERASFGGNESDINNAIKAYGHVIELLPGDDERFAKIAHSTGSLYEKRAKQFRRGQGSNCDEGISLFQLAVDCTSIDHVDMPARLDSLAIAFRSRFQNTGDLVDISQAISTFQRAVDLTPGDDPDIPERLYDLGISFRSRFKQSRELADISEAILVMQRAAQLTPEGRKKLPVRLNTLANLFHIRFESTGNLSDISEAIVALQRSAQLTPEGHSKKHVRLNALSNLYRIRFKRTKDLSDISEAILSQQKALQFTPEGHASMAALVGNLGSLFQYRFEQTGDLSDISEAVLALQKAVQLIPEGHADMAVWLGNLGRSLQFRFEWTGDFTDISEAISTQQKAMQLTPEGHSNMALLLDSIGTSLQYRFELTGKLEDISDAISAHQKAIQLIPHGHIEIPGLLGNVGLAFQTRFEHAGDLSDISNAILSHQRAVQLLPEGHADIAGHLDNLGSSFQIRFERSGDLADIREAVSVHQRAVSLTPVGHPDLAGQLADLGTAFSLLFERTEDLADISESIAVMQRSVQLTPEGHTKLAVRLSNLGLSFKSRFEYTKDLADITAAISAQQRAVQLTADGHISKAALLCNLGNSLHSRYEQAKDLADISEAILAEQKAIQLTPEGHADMTLWLYNLAVSFECMFERTGDPVDMDNAILKYRLATFTKSSPRQRLLAAQKWAKLCQKYNLSESLNAYSVAIELISQVASLEQTIQKRHENLMDVSELSTSAAAASISLGRPDMALEWLEQGRCLVWGQLNNLRTPLDNLRSHDSELADEVLNVSKALEHAGSRSQSNSSRISSTMVDKILLENEAANHLKLSQRWDLLLRTVRAIPEFEDFLRPPSCSKLLEQLPKSGPIVIINVNKDRCDALALINGMDTPIHIPLDDFSYKQAENLRSLLNQYLSSSGVRTRGHEPAMRTGRPWASKMTRTDIHEVLRQLWVHVVKPVLDGLAFSRPPSEPERIWWCATGPLAFLPLHAAGIYGDDSKTPGSLLSEYAISSYTPTVTALLEKIRHIHMAKPGTRGLLMISQPYTRGLTPIPNTAVEIETVHGELAKKNIESLCLNGSVATIARVKVEMESYGHIHLACHAIQDVKIPLKSGFELHDGRLELSDIIKKRLAVADLAFLSACQTGTGDENLSEEAVHLAAGMLAAGYRGVVATMWSIQDRYGPEIAKDFYAHLTSCGVRKDGRLDGGSAAYALHYATQCARKRLGDSQDSVLAWVPYIHMGQ